MLSRLFLTFMLLITAPSLFAKEWLFDVYLDNSKIGQHSFSLNEAGQLTSKANFNVKLLFIEAYRYDHQAIETWQGDCLTSLQSTTMENKQSWQVKGHLTDASFVVDDTRRKQHLPACSMTFAYWNPKILTQAKLLNPQNAEWLNTQVRNLGKENIKVKGTNVEVSHYLLDGTLDGKPKLKIDLWYTANNDWVGLRSTTPEGYIINYKLR